MLASPQSPPTRAVRIWTVASSRNGCYVHVSVVNVISSKPPMNPAETLTPLPVVFESLLLILEALSIFAILFLIYAAFLFRHEQRGRAVPVPKFGPVGHGLAFVVLVLFSLVIAHGLV